MCTIIHVMKYTTEGVLFTERHMQPSKTIKLLPQSLTQISHLLLSVDFHAHAIAL